jgi:hypothetical protein
VATETAEPAGVTDAASDGVSGNGVAASTTTAARATAERATAATVSDPTASDPTASNGAARPHRRAAVHHRQEAEFDAGTLLEAAEADARALREGPCPPDFVAGLDAGFERAARAALADPALVERSLRLRRLARRVVPESMRPAARTLAGKADEAARRWPILLDIGRELAALVDGMVNEAAALEGPARNALRRADAAARSTPAVHGALRQLAQLVEQSASSEDLPPVLRRLAGAADRAGRRLRAALR